MQCDLFQSRGELRWLAFHARRFEVHVVDGVSSTVDERFTSSDCGIPGNALLISHTGMV